MSGWMSKLISLHKNKATCFLCGENAGENAAFIEYRYDGGTDKAILCDKCASELDQSKLDGEDIESL